jgi:hypothetical protein
VITTLTDRKKEMELKLIGLYGPSRSGKDSVAAILRDDFGFQQKAMAEGIREILLGLNPLIVSDDDEIHTMHGLWHDCNKDWDQIKARSKESVDYMIRLGQTCRDVLGETVWLDRVLPDGELKDSICISDVRQPNEYTAIKMRGGQVWKISRPGTEKRGMDGLLDHLEFDAHIINRGSLSDLRGIVAATISADITKREQRSGYGRK